MDKALRKRNLRTAWLLAAFVLLGFISSFPFWQEFWHSARGVAG